MVNKGIKNFFTCLKYFFTPLGTMFLGIMIGISFFIPCIMSAIQTFVNGIGALGESVHLDFTEVWNTLWEHITALDWNEPNEALNTLLKVDWLTQTLTEIVSTILGTDFELFKLQIIELIQELTNSVILAFVIVFIWWLIGFIAGYILIRILIRRTIAKRGLWKYIISILFNAFLSAMFVIVCAILYAIWKPSIAISFILIIFLIEFFGLVEAFLIHGRGVVPFKKVVNLKNVGAYLITNIMIFLIALSFSLIAIIINVILGIFVGLSLIEIAFLVISMNAESYVKGLTEKSLEMA